MGASISWCTLGLHVGIIFFSYLNKVVKYTNESADRLNKDVQKISDCAHQWKMSFNPDISKQPQKNFFSRKSQKFTNLPVFFNNSWVVSIPSQKHLGVHLDEKLDFIEQIEELMNILRRKLQKLVRVLVQLKS